MSLDLAQINMRIALITPHLSHIHGDYWTVTQAKVHIMEDLIGAGIFVELFPPWGDEQFDPRRFKLTK